MRKWISLLLIGVLLQCSSVYACQALTDAGLDGDQQGILLHSFEVGRPHNLSYTLAAIAWKESSAGKYPLSITDPSAGVHGILIDNAIIYSGLPDNDFNRNRIASRLVKDPTLSADYAAINIRFWQRVFGEDNWMRVWQGFNAGYSNNSQGRKYASSIKRKIATIKECGWD